MSMDSRFRSDFCPVDGGGPSLPPCCSSDFAPSSLGLPEALVLCSARLLDRLELDERPACLAADIAGGHEGVKEDGGVPSNDRGPSG